MRLLRWGMAVTLAVGPAAAQQPAVPVAQSLFSPWDVSARTPASSELAPQDDPAEELFREGMSTLNDSRPFEAAEIFGRLIHQYPQSKYVPDAYYWLAFALTRGGTRDNNLAALRRALTTLRELRQKFPKEFKRGDGRALEQRVLGELAQRGDPDAAQAVRNQGIQVALERGPQANANCDMDNADTQSNDVKIAALNSLMQLNPDQALPTLQEILRRRDKGSLCLRRATVLLLGQRHTRGVETTLLNAVRTDPDLEVRKRAVLYLSQFNTDDAISALDLIVREVKDSELVSTAVVALSQSNDPRAKEALLAYAERNDLPKEVWRQVIGQLMQKEGNVPFLQKIYERVDRRDLDLRHKILEQLWQRIGYYGDSAIGRWYLGIAHDNSEASEVRIHALTFGGQMAPIESRMKIYAPTLARELRAQLIDAYASTGRVRQDGNAVLDDLGEIARRDPDSDLRLKALARISESKNPHAAKVLGDIINHP